LYVLDLSSQLSFVKNKRKINKIYQDILLSLLLYFSPELTPSLAPAFIQNPLDGYKQASLIC
jgi:hypothetical protein